MIDLTKTPANMKKMAAVGLMLIFSGLMCSVNKHVKLKDM